MNAAAEAFVIALGRASRREWRYLRKLDPADRDDVISTAILHCWEHRAEYDPSVPLEQWFRLAVTNARQRFRRGEAVHAEALDDNMAAQESIYATTDPAETVQAVVARLNDEERALLSQHVHGTISPEMRRAFGKLRQKLRRLAGTRRPERFELARALRAWSAPSDEDARGLAPIDREIARLERPQTLGKECPPCWRCLWYLGFMPTVAYVQRTTVPADEEVQRAVWATEARKIEIAGKIQAGTLGD